MTMSCTLYSPAAVLESTCMLVKLLCMPRHTRISRPSMIAATSLGCGSVRSSQPTRMQMCLTNACS
jgi:hypothetical protein